MLDNNMRLNMFPFVDSQRAVNNDFNVQIVTLFKSAAVDFIDPCADADHCNATGAPTCEDTVGCEWDGTSCARDWYPACYNSPAVAFEGYCNLIAGAGKGINDAFEDLDYISIDGCENIASRTGVENITCQTHRLQRIEASQGVSGLLHVSAGNMTNLLENVTCGD
jgi:hypothetical protein